MHFWGEIKMSWKEILKQKEPFDYTQEAEDYLAESEQHLREEDIERIVSEIPDLLKQFNWEILTSEEKSRKNEPIVRLKYGDIFYDGRTNTVTYQKKFNKRINLGEIEYNPSTDEYLEINEYLDMEDEGALSALYRDLTEWTVK